VDHRRRGRRPGRLSQTLPERSHRPLQSLTGTLSALAALSDISDISARSVLSVVSAAFALLVSVAPAAAQPYDSVGIRAQGMGGAFVAVADDATATWWNPAGLATGAVFNAILEYDTAQNPRQPLDTAGAALPSSRSSVRGFATAFPSLGLSYYRLRISEIRPFTPTTAGLDLSREDQRRAPVLLSSLVLQQFGATVGQSVGDHLVFASTLKLVRGAFASAGGDAASASLDNAAGLNGKAQTHGDLDLGAMAAFGPVRIGVAVKNVSQPTFQSGTDSVNLPRQARIGIAITPTRGRAPGPMTVAFDADMTRTGAPTGDERRVAGGLELRLLRRHLAVRGGLSANTIGDARPVGSGGLSLALRSGLFVDAQTTAGSDQARQSWGAALRVTY
jgi:hypothetical protein